MPIHSRAAAAGYCGCAAGESRLVGCHSLLAGLWLTVGGAFQCLNFALPPRLARALPPAAHGPVG